jgi:hypothetical protein
MPCVHIFILLNDFLNAEIMIEHVNNFISCYTVFLFIIWHHAHSSSVRVVHEVTVATESTHYIVLAVVMV